GCRAGGVRTRLCRPGGTLSRSSAGMKAVGYTSRLSAAPGDEVEFMVSCTEPRYRAELVRLLHGDDNPAGPGFKSTRVPSAIGGEYAGREQRLATGSCVVVPGSAVLRLEGSFTIQLWILPTLLR